MPYAFLKGRIESLCDKLLEGERQHKAKHVLCVKADGKRAI